MKYAQEFIALLKEMNDTNMAELPRNRFMIKYRDALDHYNTMYYKYGFISAFSSADLSRLVLSIDVDIQYDLDDEEMTELADNYASLTFKIIQNTFSILPYANVRDIIDFVGKDSSLTIK